MIKTVRGGLPAQLSRRVIYLERWRERVPLPFHDIRDGTIGRGWINGLDFVPGVYQRLKAKVQLVLRAPSGTVVSRLAPPRSSFPFHFMRRLVQLPLTFWSWHVPEAPKTCQPRMSIKHGVHVVTKGRIVSTGAVQVGLDLCWIAHSERFLEYAFCVRFWLTHFAFSSVCASARPIPSSNRLHWYREVTCEAISAPSCFCGQKFRPVKRNDKGWRRMEQTG